jgi:hypothetical protein
MHRTQSGKPTSTTSGSSAATYATFTTPAAIGLTMNALSITGGKVTATILQVGIG